MILQEKRVAKRGYEGKNPKSVWWNYVITPAAERKEMSGARDEIAKERCLEVYKQEKG